jgi:hypothetical protein
VTPRHAKPKPSRLVWLLAAIILAGVVGWATHRPGPPAISVEQNGAPVNVSVQPPSPPSVPTPRVTVTVRPPRVQVTVTPAPAAPREVAKATPLPLSGCLPDYPGEVHLGDRGEVARAWQAILIRAGVIHDRTSNRDGYFGPATQARVAELQASWGWTPIPGYAGPRTYRKLTKELC